MSNVRSFLHTGIFGLILGMAIAPSWAQSSVQAWPQRTVRLITPLGPGSGMDIAARTFAERLSQRWGQPVVVENRQGGDGIPAVQSMMADRDNHSLIYGFAGLISINPIIHEKLPYDPARDIVPVASVVDATIPLVVSEALKVASTTEFIALARAKPGQLNWAATTGLPIYIVASLQKSANIDITQISYRDFGPAFQDFATGRVHLLATGITSLLPQVNAGRGRFLFVPNRERSPLAPDVPTAVEAGFPELTFDAVNGIYGGRDMPPELKDRIAADVRAVASDPAVAERLGPTGAVMRPGTSAEFAAAIAQQRAQVAAVAQILAAKPRQ
jgi:tripartite-type tricarboxylate transporter receptor subunit TctC